ncbi:MAG TPA: response regulator [Methanothrix sp.]|nr:response regulator [Methanothrix sp.]
MDNKLATVLLVEDDETHAMLIMRSFEEMDVEKIQWVSDGQQAMDYLQHRGKYADNEKSSPPDVILLDLRLPKLNGHEVLKQIKSLEELRTIPVVILTTSKNEYDISKAYMNYANSYLVKPLGLDKFQEMVKEIEVYWLEWNQTCSSLG